MVAHLAGPLLMVALGVGLHIRVPGVGLSALVPWIVGVVWFGMGPRR